MHDGALQYEPDTVVLDLDDHDENPPIAIGRVSTEDLVAHVIVLGQRHRRTPDLKETSCGVPIHSQYVVQVREALTMTDGGLCSCCFTPHELMRALQNDQNAAEAAEDEQKKRDADDEARKAKRWRTPTGER